MIPGGYGFEVLRFEDDDIRDIVRLPKDVLVVCALPHLERRRGPDCPAEWHAPGPRVQPVYLLICHRYCVRVPPGCAYQFTNLDDFVSRYYALAEDEKKPLEPCDDSRQRHREAWHMDADGVAREYIWHPTGGWVQK
jgi:hypothetical protein